MIAISEKTIDCSLAMRLGLCWLTKLSLCGLIILGLSWLAFTQCSTIMFTASSLTMNGIGPMLASVSTEVVQCYIRYKWSSCQKWIRLFLLSDTVAMMLIFEYSFQLGNTSPPHEWNAWGMLLILANCYDGGQRIFRQSFIYMRAQQLCHYVQYTKERQIILLSISNGRTSTHPPW